MDDGGRSELDAREKVLRWLRKTGFALEMRTAEEANKHDPTEVLQSVYYVDPVTEKMREIDVLVSWNGPSAGYHVWLYLMIECKSKPSPWVIFDTNSGLTDEPHLRWRWIPHALHKDPRRADPPEAAFKPSGSAYKDLFRPSRIGINIVEAHRQSNDPNGAWDAVNGSVSAARGLMKFGTPPGTQLKPPHYIAWAVPVVVTSGLLFRSFLSGGELEVESIERGEVLVPASSQSDATRCFVVTEQGLPDLLEEAAQTRFAL